MNSITICLASEDSAYLLKKVINPLIRVKSFVAGRIAEATGHSKGTDSFITALERLQDEIIDCLTEGWCTEVIIPTNHLEDFLKELKNQRIIERTGAMNSQKSPHRRELHQDRWEFLDGLISEIAPKGRMKRKRITVVSN